MARPRKEKPETEIAERPVMGVSALAMPDAIAIMKDIVLIDNPEFTGDLEQMLGARAIGYLYARLNGMNHINSLEIANIAPIEVEMWSKKPEFQAIMGMIRLAEASMAESVTWDQAINNPSSSVERMFALKARRQEYRENGQVNNQTTTNLRITIEGQDFDVSANFKSNEE